ncbi:MAG: response regulator [Methylophilales bacterium]|nr:response regulator [Methylophilales bacterium]
MFNTNINTKEFCTTLEAAEALGVTRRTVQLWVDSKVLHAWKTPGGHMKIPVAAVNQLLAQQKKAIELAKEEDPRGFNILYVEDDLAQQKLLSNFFAKSSLKVNLHLANNGFEGLLSIGSNMPNLLISDLKMPGMDGFEMLRHLKADKSHKNLNIIAFTSMNLEEVEANGGLPDGVKLFLKPIKFKEVELYIESLLKNN